MDVILDTGVVNFFLGSVSLLAFFTIMRLTYYLVRANPAEYSIITAKKTLVVSFFYLLGMTCATVSYQNFFSDFSSYLLWWRLGLISTVTVVSFRLGNFAASLRGVVADDA